MCSIGLHLWFQFSGSGQEINALVFQTDACGFYKFSSYGNTWKYSTYLLTTFATFRMDFFITGYLEAGGGESSLYCYVLVVHAVCVSGLSDKSMGFRNEMICLRFWKLAKRVAGRCCQPHHPASTAGASVPLTKHNCFFCNLFRPAHVSRPAVFDQRFLYRSRSVCL